MKKIQYERPYKSWGVQRINLKLKVTPGAYVALRNHAIRQSAIAGIPVSVSNAIETTMMQTHDDIRKEATKINKEWKSNGKKYIDGIKSN